MYKQATIISLGKMTEKFSSFLAVIVLTYCFGPDEIGSFYYYFSFMSLMIPLMDMGLKKVFVLRSHSLSKENQRKLLGS